MDDIPVEQTVEQAFALMLHDRIVELERKLAAMERRIPDPRIKFVKKKRFPLLKIHLDEEIDLAQWLEKTVDALGKKTNKATSGLACQEYSLPAKAYVIESMFDVDAGDENELVAMLALEHAPKATVVEVHDVMNFTWFSESIAACSYCSSVYDPEKKTTRTLVERIPVAPEDDTLWFMLNGWLTSVMEGVDIENTRAFDSLSASLHLRNLQ